MNSIYDNNMTFLHEHGFDIEQVHSEINADYIIEPAVNGVETIKIKDENGNYIYAHSKYDPILIAEKFTTSLKIHKESVIIFYGIGLGYELLNVIKKCKKTNSILVYEPCKEILVEFFRRYSLEEITKTTSINFFTHNEMFFNYMSIKLDAISVENFIKYYNFAYSCIFNENYKKVFAYIDFIYRNKYISKSTVLNYGRKWVENATNNIIPFLESYSLDNMTNIFKGKPGVLVSGGPSLTKNVELLRKVKGKYVIVCVYTAYRVLMKYGIEPDFVVAIDGNQPIYEQHKKNGINIPVIYCSNVNSEFLEVAKKEKIILYSVGEHISLNVAGNLKKVKKLTNDGGSVACNSFDVLNHMGCDPIIFIGQDLAYTDNKTHATGTLDGDKIVSNDDDEKILVDAYYGGKIETSYMLEYYLEWFNTNIKEMASNKTVINATEGGAKIEGTIQMPFSQVIDTYKGIDDTQIIANNFFKTDKIFNKDEIVLCYEYIQKTKIQLETIETVAKEAIIVSEELVELYKKETQLDVKKVLSLTDKLDEIDSVIKENEEVLHMLGVLYQRVLYFSRTWLPKEMSDDQLIITRNLIKYEKIIELISFANEHFDKMLFKIEKNYNIDTRCNTDE